MGNLCYKLDSKVDSKIDSKVDGKVDSKIDNKVDGKVDSKIDNKVDSKVDSKVDNKLDSSYLDRLYKMTIDDFDAIPLNRYSNKYMVVRICDIYDGDTFSIVFYDKEFKHMIKLRCRLNGIDAPEKKIARNIVGSKRKQLKQKASQAIDTLTSWVLSCNEDEILICHTNKHQEDPYGRLLADIHKVKRTDIPGDPQLTLNIDNGYDADQYVDKHNALSTYMLENTASKEYHGGTKDTNF